MSTNLWDICNELDATAANQEAILDAMAFVMDGLEQHARSTKAFSLESLQKFTLKFLDFSKMLFAILGSVQAQNAKIQELTAKAFELQNGVKKNAF